MKIHWKLVLFSGLLGSTRASSCAGSNCAFVPIITITKDDHSHRNRNKLQKKTPTRMINRPRSHNNKNALCMSNFLEHHEDSEDIQQRGTLTTHIANNNNQANNDSTDASIIPNTEASPDVSNDVNGVHPNEVMKSNNGVHVNPTHIPPPPNHIPPPLPNNNLKQDLLGANTQNWNTNHMNIIQPNPTRRRFVQDNTDSFEQRRGTIGSSGIQRPMAGKLRTRWTPEWQRQHEQEARRIQDMEQSRWQELEWQREQEELFEQQRMEEEQQRLIAEQTRQRQAQLVVDAEEKQRRIQAEMERQQAALEDQRRQGEERQIMQDEREQAQQEREQYERDMEQWQQYVQQQMAADQQQQQQRGRLSKPEPMVIRSSSSNPRARNANYGGSSQPQPQQQQPSYPGPEPPYPNQPQQPSSSMQRQQRPNPRIPFSGGGSTSSQQLFYDDDPQQPPPPSYYDEPPPRGAYLDSSMGVVPFPDERSPFDDGPPPPRRRRRRSPRGPPHARRPLPLAGPGPPPPPPGRTPPRRRPPPRPGMLQQFGRPPPPRYSSTPEQPESTNQRFQPERRVPPPRPRQSPPRPTTTANDKDTPNSHNQNQNSNNNRRRPTRDANVVIDTSTQVFGEEQEGPSMTRSANTASSSPKKRGGFWDNITNAWNSVVQKPPKKRPKKDDDDTNAWYNQGNDNDDSSFPLFMAAGFLGTTALGLSAPLSLYLNSPSTQDAFDMFKGRINTQPYLERPLDSPPKRKPELDAVKVDVPSPKDTTVAPPGVTPPLPPPVEKKVDPMPAPVPVMKDATAKVNAKPNEPSPTGTSVSPFSSKNVEPPIVAVPAPDPYTIKETKLPTTMPPPVATNTPATVTTKPAAPQNQPAPATPSGPAATNIQDSAKATPLPPIQAATQPRASDNKIPARTSGPAATSPPATTEGTLLSTPYQATTPPRATDSKIPATTTGPATSSVQATAKSTPPTPTQSLDNKVSDAIPVPAATTAQATAKPTPSKPNQPTSPAATTSVQPVSIKEGKDLNTEQKPATGSAKNEVKAGTAPSTNTVKEAQASKATDPSTTQAVPDPPVKSDAEVGVSSIPMKKPSVSATATAPSASPLEAQPATKASIEPKPSPTSTNDYLKTLESGRADNKPTLEKTATKPISSTPVADANPANTGGDVKNSPESIAEAPKTSTKGNLRSADPSASTKTENESTPSPNDSKPAVPTTSVPPSSQKAATNDGQFSAPPNPILIKSSSQPEQSTPAAPTEPSTNNGDVSDGIQVPMKQSSDQKEAPETVPSKSQAPDAKESQSNAPVSREIEKKAAAFIEKIKTEQKDPPVTPSPIKEKAPDIPPFVVLKTSLSPASPTTSNENQPKATTAMSPPSGAATKPETKQQPPASTAPTPPDPESESESQTSSPKVPVPAAETKQQSPDRLPVPTLDSKSQRAPPTVVATTTETKKQTPASIPAPQPFQQKPAITPMPRTEAEASTETKQQPPASITAPQSMQLKTANQAPQKGTAPTTETQEQPPISTAIPPPASRQDDVKSTNSAPKTSTTPLTVAKQQPPSETVLPKTDNAPAPKTQKVDSSKMEQAQTAADTAAPPAVSPKPSTLVTPPNEQKAENTAVASSAERPGPSSTANPVQLLQDQPGITPTSVVPRPDTKPDAVAQASETTALSSSPVSPTKSGVSQTKPNSEDLAQAQTPIEPIKPDTSTPSTMSTPDDMPKASSGETKSALGASSDASQLTAGSFQNTPKPEAPDATTSPTAVTTMPGLASSVDQPSIDDVSPLLEGVDASIPKNLRKWFRSEKDASPSEHNQPSFSSRGKTTSPAPKPWETLPPRNLIKWTKESAVDPPTIATPNQKQEERRGPSTVQNELSSYASIQMSKASNFGDLGRTHPRTMPSQYSKSPGSVPPKSLLKRTESDISFTSEGINNLGDGLLPQMPTPAEEIVEGARTSAVQAELSNYASFSSTDFLSGAGRQKTSASIASGPTEASNPPKSLLKQIEEVASSSPQSGASVTKESLSIDYSAPKRLARASTPIGQPKQPEVSAPNSLLKQTEDSTPPAVSKTASDTSTDSFPQSRPGAAYEPPSSTMTAADDTPGQMPKTSFVPRPPPSSFNQWTGGISAPNNPVPSQSSTRASAYRASVMTSNAFAGPPKSLEQAINSEGIQKPQLTPVPASQETSNAVDSSTQQPDSRSIQPEQIRSAHNSNFPPTVLQKRAQQTFQDLQATQPSARVTAPGPGVTTNMLATSTSPPANLKKLASQSIDESNPPAGRETTELSTPQTDPSVRSAAPKAQAPRGLQKWMGQAAKQWTPPTLTSEKESLEFSGSGGPKATIPAPSAVSDPNNMAFARAPKTLDKWVEDDASKPWVSEPISAAGTTSMPPKSLLAKAGIEEGSIVPDSPQNEANPWTAADDTNKADSVPPDNPPPRGLFRWIDQASQSWSPPPS